MRTRKAAAALADAGHLRINGTRADGASQRVRRGDVLTVALNRGVKMLKVVALGARRGSGPAALALYEDLSNASANRVPPPVSAARIDDP